MKLTIGIIGLPNAGKSTLFNLLTQQRVKAENYPFCTIDPNIGAVAVPDKRLTALAALIQPTKTIPAAVEFYDIAGLVKNAHQGAGLGNQFLAQIRNVQAVLIVLRCFSGNIAHPEGAVDPLRDLEIINAELILKDLETIKRRWASLEKKVKSCDSAAEKENNILESAKQQLEKGKLIEGMAEDEFVKNLGLLTAKKQFYLFNGQKTDINPSVLEKTKGYGNPFLAMDLKAGADNKEKLASLIQGIYEMLGLVTFFTINPKESRAWIVKRETPALKAAGIVHSDFEKKFIKAEVVGWQSLIRAGSWAEAKKRGMVRLEGKRYLVSDGDVLYFHHS